MILVRRKALCKCYICGTENPLMFKNKAGKFNIRCSNRNCRGRTRWLNKDDAICEWYLLYLYGPMQKKRVQALVNEQREEESKEAAYIEAYKNRGKLEDRPPAI